MLLSVVRNRPINGVGRNKGLGALNLVTTAELIQQKLGVLLHALDKQDFFVFLKDGFQRRNVGIGIDLQSVAGGHQETDHFVELLSGAKDDQRAKMLRHEVVGKEAFDLLEVMLQRGFL